MKVHLISQPPTSLAGKLDLLLRRLASRAGRQPTVRDLAASTAPAPGEPPAISHVVINDLLNGKKSNPPCTTIQAVALAFDAPAAYLLPGWDDLTSLTVYQQQPQAREALRQVADLGPEGAAELLAAAREIRARRGLDSGTVPEVPDIAPLAADNSRPGRRRGGRRNDADMAERAATT